MALHQDESFNVVDASIGDDMLPSSPLLSPFDRPLFAHLGPLRLGFDVEAYATDMRGLQDGFVLSGSCSPTACRIPRFSGIFGKVDFQAKGPEPLLLEFGLYLPRYPFCTEARIIIILD